MDVSVEVSGIDRINGILEEFARTSPKSLGRRVKQAAYLICDSLGAVAKKKKAKKELKIGTPEVAASRSGPYPTITKKVNGEKVKLHRWRWIGHVGTSAKYEHLKYVYAKKSEQQELRALFYGEGRFKGFGRIHHSGLLANSFKWIKKDLHGATDDAVVKMMKFDKRDPRKDVAGEFVDFTTGPNAGAAATIENKLDYAEKVISESEQDGAIKSATNKMVKNIELEIQTLEKAMEEGTVTRAQIRRLAELKTFSERVL